MEKCAKSQNKKSKSTSSASAPLVPAAPESSSSQSVSTGGKQAAADMAYNVLMGNKKFAQPQPPNRVSTDAAGFMSKKVVGGGGNN